MGRVRERCYVMKTGLLTCGGLLRAAAGCCGLTSPLCDAIMPARPDCDERVDDAGAFFRPTSWVCGGFRQVQDKCTIEKRGR